MKKLLCLFVVVGIVATSHASFEMALVAQFHTAPNGSVSKKIGRWDPQNGVNLGYFGAGLVNGNAIALDVTQTNTVADIYGGATNIFFQRFNYSTGENLGLSSISLTGGNSISDAQILASGQFLATGTIGGVTSARLINFNGTIVRNYNLPAGTLFAASIFQNSAGVTFILTRQAGSVSGSKYTLTSYAANSALITSTITVADNSTTAYEHIIQSGGNIIVGTDLVSSRRIYPLSGATLSSNIGSGGYAAPSGALFSGHGNSYYSMGLETATNRVYLNTMNGTDLGSYVYFEGTQYGAITDAAMVVAPEPMTMVGLGLGLAVMLRRRKNSAV